MLDGRIDDPVVDGGDIRHVEDIAQRPLQHVLDRSGKVAVFGQGKMQRDRRFRGLHIHRHAVILDQQPDLLFQIIAEQFRIGQRRRIDAGSANIAEGQARIDPRVRCR